MKGDLLVHVADSRQAKRGHSWCDLACTFSNRVACKQSYMQTCTICASCTESKSQRYAAIALAATIAAAVTATIASCLMLLVVPCCE